MRKVGIIGVLSMLLVAFSASVALAANPHVVFEGTATENQEAGTVTVSGFKATGLGEEQIRVELTTVGVAQVECFNPGTDEGPVPGQDAEVQAQAEPILITPEKSG
jgi:hypothetical protein